MKANSLYKNEIAGINGMKTIAICSVVLFSMFPGVVCGGHLAASLFFVLSGYLLAVTTLQAEKNNRFSLPVYYMRLIRRIYPALVVVMGVTVLFLNIAYPQALSGIHREVFSALFGYNNWWLVAQNVSDFSSIVNASPLSHIWPLAIILQFYLIWPVLFVGGRKLEQCTGKKISMWIMLALAAISLVEMSMLYRLNSDMSRIYYGTDTRSHALFLGAALGFAQEEGRDSLKSKLAGKILFSICCIGFAVMTFIARGASQAVYLMFVILSALMSVILVDTTTDLQLPFVKSLAWKPIAWFGNLSYELYLCAFPTIYLVQRWQPVENVLLLALIELAIMLFAAVVIHLLTRAKPILHRNSGLYISKKVKPFLYRNIETYRVRIAALAIFILVVAAGFTMAKAAVQNSGNNQHQGSVETQNGATETHDTTAATDNIETTQTENISTTSPEPAITTSPDTVTTTPPETVITTPPEPIVTTPPETVVTTPPEPIVTTPPETVVTTPPETIVTTPPDTVVTTPPETVVTTPPETVVTTPPETVTTAPTDPVVVPSELITFVGDSVMLGASNALKERLPSCVVDAKESRQIWHAADVLTALEAEGKLGNIVVIGLGTNCPFSVQQGQDVIDLLGTDRKIYWITVYGASLDWQEDSNASIRAVAEQNAHVKVIDWAIYADGQTGWFYNDGIHLGQDGQKAYADFMVQQISS